MPFYSQFEDITSPKWQKVGCGIASLAMVIDFYKPDAVSVDTLLGRAIASGAYDQNAGWKHKDLVLLAKNYGLRGDTYDLANLGKQAAFTKLKNQLKDGPVIVSVHYQFDPKSSIPHLVVLDGIENDTIYYNDPASKGGQKKISSTLFLKAWKMKFIVVRPNIVDTKPLVAESVPDVKTGKLSLLISFSEKFRQLFA